MSEDRLPKKLLFGTVEGTGPRGRPVNTWNKIACNDLGELKAAYSWYRIVSGRPALETVDCTLTYLAGDLIPPRQVYNADDDQGAGSHPALVHPFAVAG